STDTQNRSSSGIPREVVLSPRLREISAATFGPGLRDPLKRPGIAKWSGLLHAAADATLTCPSCHGTFYFTASRCPWCDRPRSVFATAAFNLWDPSLGPGVELL